MTAMGFPALLISGVTLVALLLLVLLLARDGYLGQVRWRLAKHGDPVEVVDLHSLNELEAAFNEDVGAPRLVLLFSPT
jgi:hypothetical protein